MNGDGQTKERRETFTPWTGNMITHTLAAGVGALAGAGAGLCRGFGGGLLLADVSKRLLTHVICPLPVLTHRKGTVIRNDTFHSRSS